MNRSDADELTFRDIADLWAQETQGKTGALTVEEILDKLVKKFWRGEFKGDDGKSCLAINSDSVITHGPDPNLISFDREDLLGAISLTPLINGIRDMALPRAYQRFMERVGGLTGIADLTTQCPGIRWPLTGLMAAYLRHKESWEYIPYIVDWPFTPGRPDDAGNDEASLQKVLTTAADLQATGALSLSAGCAQILNDLISALRPENEGDLYSILAAVGIDEYDSFSREAYLESLTISRHDFCRCHKLDRPNFWFRGEREGSGENSPLTHTGLPGRPNTKHLVQDEFNRMIEAGEAVDVLVENARRIYAWHIKAYPKLARPALKTICNTIRERHKETKSESPKI